MSYRAYAVASKANAGGRRQTGVSFIEKLMEAARVSYRAYALTSKARRQAGVSFIGQLKEAVRMNGQIDVASAYFTRRNS